MIRSPVNDRALSPDTPHSLSDGPSSSGGQRWPVVDGIPYLRVGREALVAEALAHLDAGRNEDALVALLADQDDWWTGPATDADELRRLVRGRDTLTLREAMALLRFGPVADYFAYRWSDPTYLAGLALIEAHWNAPRQAFELACGIGHYLRELTRRGVACTGADVVFAKCWLAKHWVAPEAEYVVFDAAAPWPLGQLRFELRMCHDAFYFLPEPKRVAERLRFWGQGVMLVSHLHNAGFAEGAKGPAKSYREWARLFPKAKVYDERALLAALVTGGVPQPARWCDDAAVEAWSIVEDGPKPRGVTGGVAMARAVTGGVAMPPQGAALRPNPLLRPDGSVDWPSDRWRDEYGWGCAWASGDGEPIRTRGLVDLPERW